MDHKTVSSKEPPPETEKAVPTTANPRNVQHKLNARSEVPAIENSEPLIAWRPVRITLELIDAASAGATAIAHSPLDKQDAARIIRVGLCSTHLLVNRSQPRADTFAVKFLVGLALTEYCLFWSNTTDGRGITQALRQAAGYSSGENNWRSGFASRLAISDLLHPVDGMPIFGAGLTTETVTLPVNCFGRQAEMVKTLKASDPVSLGCHLHGNKFEGENGVR
jgi:hypothetical protein